MELEPLLEKLRMEHLGAQLDTICEQAAKRELGDREFLLDALLEFAQGQLQHAHGREHAWSHRECKHVQRAHGGRARAGPS